MSAHVKREQLAFLGRSLAAQEPTMGSDLDKTTMELARTNLRLTQEMEERQKAEDSLSSAYSQMKRLKDRLQAENLYLQQEAAREHNFGELIGQSSALSQLHQAVQWVAPMNATVLLLGETGTGKGVAARAIHNSSTRVSRPLITVNLTALQADLIEGELFGWERGACTGADTRQMGRFELADEGTIFLEEIGQLPLELQGRLLRLIQTGELERMGNPRTVKVDLRIIAASSRDLEQEVRCGRFREDLLARLKVFLIAMVPLRKRKEDIPPLVDHFVTKYSRKIGKSIETVAKETMDALTAYSWPGNVLELESVIKRAVTTSRGTTLRVLDHFETPGHVDPGLPEDMKGLMELEQEHIIHVLEKTGWRIEGKSGAAALLGLNPSTLRGRMRKHGILRRFVARD